MDDQGPSPSPSPPGHEPRRVPVVAAAAGAGGIGLGIVGAILVIGLLSRPAPGSSPDPSLVALGPSPSPAILEPGSGSSPGQTLGGATLDPGDDPAKPRAGSAPPESAAAPPSVAPVTAAPVTPKPVTPRPVTPKPVTPKPVTPKPVTPRPVTPAPPPPDPAPVARNDAWSASALDTPYGAHCLVDLPTFDNDSDEGPTWADGSPFKTVTPLMQATHGDLSLKQLSGVWHIRYVPHHDGPFTDTFSYTIKDAAEQTDSASVTVSFGSAVTGCH